jgi:hypothetical protein
MRVWSGHNYRLDAAGFCKRRVADTDGYAKLQNFDPTLGRISVRLYSHQYEGLIFPLCFRSKRVHSRQDVQIAAFGSVTFTTADGS